ncbi:MAG: zf-HC2 domain-containing protein, partial [Polyangiales bacterium]
MTTDAVEQSCLSDDDVSELAEGLLSRDRLDAIDAHLADCPSCRALVGEVVKSLLGVARAASDRPDAFALLPVDPAHY